MRKFLGGLLLIVGVSVFSFGSHVSRQASQGQEKVAAAEQKMQEHDRPTLGPARRHAKKDTSETAQRKIDAAEQKIVQSRVTANWLHGTGIALFVIGMGCLISSHKKRD